MNTVIQGEREGLRCVLRERRNLWPCWSLARTRGSVDSESGFGSESWAMGERMGEEVGVDEVVDTQ